jgi:hypothetical protein
MESPLKMDVDNWRDSPLPLVPKAKPRRRFLPPTLIGILGTGLLHSMLIQSVAFGTRGAKQKTPETQESASALSKSTDEGERLVLISLPTSANASLAARNPISSLPDLTKMKVKLKIDIDSPALLGLETLALSEDRPVSTSAGGVDGADQARLFGIYTGQIQARIDRVWRRPRSSVSEGTAAGDGGESFQCEAQIVQDVRGNVQEILLPRCNGAAAWQLSLVRAIQQASPLPAPPSDKVFNSSITLRFVGLPYVSGSSPDEYEFEPQQVR